MGRSGQEGRDAVAGEGDEHGPVRGDEIYVELARRGLTLKAWFTGEVVRLLAEADQPALFAAERAAPSYGTAPDGSKENL